MSQSTPDAIVCQDAEEVARVAQEILERDGIEHVLSFARPPLDFRESDAVPLAEAADPAAVLAMEAAWEAAWGRPLAEAV